MHWLWSALAAHRLSGMPTARATDGWEHTFVCAKVEPGRGEVPPWPWADVENKYRFTRYVEKTEGIAILKARIPGSWKKG